MARKRYGSGYGGESSSRGHSAAFVTRKNSGEGKKNTQTKDEKPFPARGGVSLHIIYIYIHFRSSIVLMVLLESLLSFLGTSQ